MEPIVIAANRTKGIGTGRKFFCVFMPKIQVEKIPAAASSLISSLVDACALAM
jgi:hypothetical protein